MLLKRKLNPKLIGLGLLFFILTTFLQTIFAQDSTSIKKDTVPLPGTTLRYPIQDRRGDFISTDKRTFDLNQPSNIQDSIAYDPVSKKYYVYEKIGSKYYRTPTWYTFEEFMRLQSKKDEREYFQKRANTLSLLNRRLVNLSSVFMIIFSTVYLVMER